MLKFPQFVLVKERSLKQSLYLLYDGLVKTDVKYKMYCWILSRD